MFLPYGAYRSVSQLLGVDLAFTHALLQNHLPQDTELFWSYFLFYNDLLYINHIGAYCCIVLRIPLFSCAFPANLYFQRWSKIPYKFEIILHFPISLMFQGLLINKLPCRFCDWIEKLIKMFVMGNFQLSIFEREISSHNWRKLWL